MVDHAHFFRPSPDGELPFAFSWETVQPSEYDEATHKGYLRCPGSSCRAPLGFVPESYGDGREIIRVAHFSANQGRGHETDCEFSSSAQSRITARLSEIAELNKNLLLNYNGPTLPEKFAARAKSPFAKATLEAIGGYDRQVWRRDHKGEFGTSPVKSIEGLMSQVSKWKELSGEGSLSERCHISHLGNIISWPQFFLSDHNDAHKSRSDHHIRSIFDACLTRSLHMSRQQMHTSALPRMRWGLKNMYPNSSNEKASPLIHTTSERPVMVDGKRVMLRDVIQASDPTLRDVLKTATDFSVISTPNIQAWSVAQGMKGDAPAIYMFWPVEDESQIHFGAS